MRNRQQSATRHTSLPNRPEPACQSTNGKFRAKVAPNKKKGWLRRKSSGRPSGKALALLLALLVVVLLGWSGRHLLIPEVNIIDDRVHSYSNDVTIFAGTRPEVIKLAPVVEGLVQVGIPPRVVSTGQHSSMLKEAADSLGLAFTDKLKWTRKSSSLKDLFAEIFKSTYDYLLEHRPRVVVIQGDTTTALAVGLAAKYLHVEIAHVEAGLRTFDAENPFPEETNRVLLDHMSSLLFAPTKIAESNLIDEGICPDRIFTVGNTVVDSLHKIRALNDGHSWVRSVRTRYVTHSPWQ
jgi:hypothetical protein